MADFAFYRQPREIQLIDFERYKDKPYFALFYDPRVGKTKVVLDIFRYRYERGDVDALVIISYPSGVKYVWIDEAPKDLPPAFCADMLMVLWDARKTVKGERRTQALAARNHPGPIMISLNCESIARAEHCTKFIDEWIGHRRKVMLVADESSWAAKWSGQTQRLLMLGGYYAPRPNVVIKAILDGTPVDESPIEIFHPSQFLKRGLIGYDSKTAFRARYEQYEEEDVIDDDGVLVRRRVIRRNHNTNKDYPTFIGYRHLDELRERMMSFGSRVRRDEVSDAPPKIYQSAYFEMTPKQRRVYDRLRDEYIAELDRDVSVDHVLKRMLRLQMIARNYYPPEPAAVLCPACHSAEPDCLVCDGLGVIIRPGDLTRIDTRNPAVEVLLTAIKPPFVVWCRFRQDAADAHAALRMKYDVFLYTGAVPDREREDGYQRFKSGVGDGIVATLASGLTRGKDLSRARLLVYYSNDFRRRMRTQSEDRAEGIDRTVSTDIVDLLATDTQDIKIIDALRAKRDLAALVMGDPPRWL